MEKLLKIGLSDNGFDNCWSLILDDENNIIEKIYSTSKFKLPKGKTFDDYILYVPSSEEEFKKFIEQLF